MKNLTDFRKTVETGVDPRLSATNAVLADYIEINELSAGCARNAWFPRAITNCVPCDAVLVLILFKTMFTKYNTLLKREKDGHYFKLGHFLNSPSPLRSHSPLKFNMTVKQDKFDLTGNSENYSCFLKLARKLSLSFILSDIALKALQTIQVNMFLFNGTAAQCTPIMGILFYCERPRKITCAVVCHLKLLGGRKHWTATFVVFTDKN